MALLEQTAGLLAIATTAPPRTREAGGRVFRPTVFADDPPAVAAPLGAAGPRVGTITIQDVLHPWVLQDWPADLPIPGGWVALGGALGVGGFQGIRPGGPITVDSVPESSPAAGLVRHAAETAAEAAAFRSLRETIAELHREQALRGLGPRVTPGGLPIRPGRPARFSRLSRRPRTPRTPRPPRAPRVNGTKGTLGQKACPMHRTLGGCEGSSGCNIPAELLGPNVGHSTCNWGPMNADCECVDAGCTGAAASLLKPFLDLLPKYWTAEAVAAITRAKETTRTAQRAARKFAGLPPLSKGAAQVPPTTFTIDPRANVAGCYCYDWPGWAICPNCSRSAKCRCGGSCIAFPASSGNC